MVCLEPSAAVWYEYSEMLRYASSEGSVGTISDTELGTTSSLYASTAVKKAAVYDFGVVPEPVPSHENQRMYSICPSPRDSLVLVVDRLKILFVSRNVFEAGSADATPDAA